MAQSLSWIVGVIVVAYILYGINRRHRWMFANGFAEETKSTGGGPFLVLREFIEPSVENIRHIREEQQHRAEREASGEKSKVEDSPVQ